MIGVRSQHRGQVASSPPGDAVESDESLSPSSQRDALSRSAPQPTKQAPVKQVSKEKQAQPKKQVQKQTAPKPSPRGQTSRPRAELSAARQQPDAGTDDLLASVTSLSTAA